MSCNTCKSECGREDGCGSRKAEQKVILDELCARLYPTRTWGEPEPRACLEDGIDHSELLTLAGRLATTLRAPAYVVEGSGADLCSYIYVLCLGREPALIELRDAMTIDEPLLLEADTLRERYLRIACSRLGRLACVQEVAMELSTASDDCPAGFAAIRELSMPGVFDPKLLKRFQKTVDLLQAHGIEHLDMGLLDVDAAAFELLPGDYARRFGTAPALINYLFYAQPVKTSTVTYLPWQRPTQTLSESDMGTWIVNGASSI